MTTLIFVHGACVRDGEWWWSPMVAPLAARGIDTRTVALPSCGEGPGERGDLYADVDACRRAIAEVEGDVVLCGHSYGGMVITEAGIDPRVSGLIYVASVMPAAGQSQGEIIGDAPSPWVVPGEIEGTVTVVPQLIRDLFLQDCDEPTTAAALEHLAQQSAAVFGQGAREVAWEQTPSTYVICTQDLSLPGSTQHDRVRPGTRALEFDAGHHPFLSRPEAFADALAGVIS